MGRDTHSRIVSTNSGRIHTYGLMGWLDRIDIDRSDLMVPVSPSASIAETAHHCRCRSLSFLSP